MKAAGLILVGMLAAGSVIATSTEEKGMVEQARSLAKQFGGQLKAEVAAGMKSGGPVATIDVCSVKAPMIAASVGTESGWDVGRTSLKLRNPNNVPDDWERNVLIEFERRKAAGEAVATMEFAETVNGANGPAFRYMKAIGTEQVCLNCHAAEIKPDVEEKLMQLYPQDAARGFAVGDIRGAFTFSKPL
ncbi:MAG: DUF3365 domain-containing protein [Gammaproteobacteria bacterium]|nr:DUF3365 domain-containing protein [Gammaproteobacteria bacterium]